MSDKLGPVESTILQAIKRFQDPPGVKLTRCPKGIPFHGTIEGDVGEPDTAYALFDEWVPPGVIQAELSAAGRKSKTVDPSSMGDAFRRLKNRGLIDSKVIVSVGSIMRGKHRPGHLFEYKAMTGETVKIKHVSDGIVWVVGRHAIQLSTSESGWDLHYRLTGKGFDALGELTIKRPHGRPLKTTANMDTIDRNIIKLARCGEIDLTRRMSWKSVLEKNEKYFRGMNPNSLRVRAVRLLSQPNKK